MEARKTILRGALIAVAITMAMAGAGCIFGATETPPTGEVREPTTPENVIYNLEFSYNTRDIQLYKQCLSDNFTFYFNASDVGTDVNGYVIPSSWGYEDDWTSADNMFKNAYEITMELPEGDVGEPSPSDTTYTATNISISLLVMVDADNGFIANKGTLEFTFVKDPDNPNYWVIKDWRDFTYA
jgi:hypothetical protein